jgi:TM2 domain-containing membrane protein YozV
MKPLTEKTALARDRNIMAAALSLFIPGMGHLYKAHYGAGVTLILLGIPFAIWVGILLSLATAGIGLLFPVMFWLGVAVDAYLEEDWRTRHVMEVL